MAQLPATMRAVRCDRYGPPDVLGVAEVPLPAVGEDALLVRVVAAALNPKDCLVRKGKFRRFDGGSFPRGTGYDFAGEVVASIGADHGFKPGDQVYGMVNGWLGSTCADYVVAKPAETALKPRTLALREAAAVPLAALTALQALRDHGRIEAGRSVLINGASGGVGTFAVQIAKAFGADVTAVSSQQNHDLVRSLGADRMVDYKRVRLERVTGGPFDIVFDVFGNKSFLAMKHLLTPRGAYVTTVPNPANILWHLATPLPLLKRARLVAVKSRRDDLRALAEMVDQGQIKPVIDRMFTPGGAGEAHGYIETKRARGKVLILFAGDEARDNERDGLAVGS